MPAKRSNGIETAKKILEFAIQELDEVGPSRFNLDRIIEKAEISRSSLYHHYGNREGLLIAVELHRLEKNLLTNDQQARELLKTISTPEEAFAIIEFGIISAASEQQRVIRTQRFASFAASEHAPALRHSLEKMQKRAVIEFSETIRLVRDKGFIDPIEPIEGTAHFIQSFLLGRMLVDVLNDPVADSQWHFAAMAAVRTLLQPRVTSDF
jgi:AcrR family transcriptional regulator